jgi:hypothetical protein
MAGLGEPPEGVQPAVAVDDEIARTRRVRSICTLPVSNRPAPSSLQIL